MKAGHVSLDAGRASQRWERFPIVAGQAATESEGAPCRDNDRAAHTINSIATRSVRGTVGASYTPFEHISRLWARPHLAPNKLSVVVQ